MDIGEHGNNAQDAAHELTGSRTKVIALNGHVENGKLFARGGQEGVSICLVGTVGAEGEVEAIVEVALDNSFSESLGPPVPGMRGPVPNWGGPGPGRVRPPGGWGQGAMNRPWPERPKRMPAGNQDQVPARQPQDSKVQASGESDQEGITSGRHVEGPANE